MNISLAGKGEFTVMMALFQDPNYTLPYEGAAVTLPVESMLYVGALLERGDTGQFKLLLRHCYATPTADRTDPVKYFIIRNRYQTPLGLAFGLNEVLGGNDHLGPAGQLCDLLPSPRK